MPSTAKGSIRKVEVSCVAWVDLLGYGKQIAESGFNPLEPKAQAAIARLDRLHTVVSQRASKLFPTLALNDGVIAFRDLSPRSHTVTFDFLRDSVHLFQAINAVESSNSDVGARMVIAPGFRARRAATEPARKFGGRETSIARRLDAGVIDANQAIAEALQARPYFDTTRELQANFALTRAYLADESGKEHGIAGPHCYIDLSLFADPPPSWIRFSRLVDWSYRGMQATFGCLAGLDESEAGSCFYSGILDAFKVARALSDDPDIESKVRAA